MAKVRAQYIDKKGKRHIVAVHLCKKHLKAFHKGKLEIQPRKGKKPLIHLTK